MLAATGLDRDDIQEESKQRLTAMPSQVADEDGPITACPVRQPRKSHVQLHMLLSRKQRPSIPPGDPSRRYVQLYEYCVKRRSTSVCSMHEPKRFFFRSSLQRPSRVGTLHF